MTLRRKIEQEIQQRCPIPFSRYMELCLYDPELGYYSRSQEKFGKAGDFYTSSDVHAVFGRLLVRQFEEMWRTLGSPSEIELLELKTGRVWHIARLAKPSFYGFTVSPDERSLIYSQFDRTERSILLAKNFR